MGKKTIAPNELNQTNLWFLQFKKKNNMFIREKILKNFRKYEGNFGLKSKKSNKSNWFEILFLQNNSSSRFRTKLN